MGATSGAGTSYPSRAPDLNPGFKWGSCYSIFSSMCMFCRSLFVLFSFFFWQLRCLQFTDSDYPFGFFKLFLRPLATQLRSSLKIFKASHYPYDILKLFWIVQFLSQLQRMCLHCFCIKQTFYKPRKIERGKRLHLICPPSWDACSLNCDLC
jgi:hypothetical protein